VPEREGVDCRSKVKHFGLLTAGAGTIRGPMRSSRNGRCRASTRWVSKAGRRVDTHPLRNFGIGFVPFSPRGRDSSPGREDRRQHGVHFVRPPDEIPVLRRSAKGESGDGRAAEHNRGAQAGNPAQIALAWLLAQKPWSCPSQVREVGARWTRTWSSRVELTQRICARQPRCRTRSRCQVHDTPSHMTQDRTLGERSRQCRTTQLHGRKRIASNTHLWRRRRALERARPREQEPTDAVVRVLRSCVCGSDLWPYRSMPHAEHGNRMGHEFRFSSKP